MKRTSMPRGGRLRPRKIVWKNFGITEVGTASTDLDAATLKAGIRALKRSRLRPISKKQRALMPLDAATRLRILERDGWTCRRCGRGGIYSGVLVEVHHVHTRRTPSTRHADDNLVTLCAGRVENCHEWAHDHGKAFREWWSGR